MNPLDVMFTVVALALLTGVVGVIRGPTDGDRAVAGDLAFYAFIAAVAILGTRLGGSAFFAVVLVAALVGFLSSVSVARLIDREDRREREEDW
jgi:multicomponent Na+:H+ antiporter subunit F